MKNIIVFISLLALTSATAQTVIPGGLVSGTWYKSGSPYLIQGNIMVPDNTTLAIQPGVTLNFQGNYKLLVGGNLIAVGTNADSIHFTASNIATGWQGIRFENTPLTNDSSKISYCAIHYGFIDNGNGGGIYISNFSKISITHSTITNCTANQGFGGGIYIASSNAIVTENNISFNHSIAGGIYINGGKPLISNNYISYNDNVLPVVFPSVGGDPDNTGGGISCYNSTATIINNVIIHNSSNSHGGGISAEAGSPAISNNSLSYNHSTGDGGGIYCSGSLVINDNNISNNSSETNGGGVYFAGFGSATFNKNIILNNSAVSSGGGMVSYSTSAVITNNIISNNSLSLSPVSSYLGGGGIWFVSSDSSTIVVNNIISNNSAINGGAILCYNANPKLCGNTIANNSATNGGALFCVGSSPTLLNMLLSGNTASNAGTDIFLNDDSSDPAITFSNVPGGVAAFFLNGNFYTGTYKNNIDANPLFTSASNGSGTAYNGASANWALRNASPCINKGKTGTSYPAQDFLGNTRVIAGVIDMGAIENQNIINVCLGIKDSNWENPANWSRGILPDSNTYVIIPSGAVVLNASTVIKSLTVNPNSSFKIISGVELKITH